MKLKNWGMAATAFTAISAACFLSMNSVYEHLTLFLWVTFLSTICAVVSLLVFCIGIIVGKRKTKHSHGVVISTVFSIVMLVAGICSAAWGIYDMATDGGFMGGIRGALVLMFLVPAEAVVFLISLVISIMLWKKEKKMREKVQETVFEEK